jgi:hypothetical protein
MAGDVNANVEAILTSGDGRATITSKGTVASKLHEDAYQPDGRSDNSSGKTPIAQGYIQPADANLVKNQQTEQNVSKLLPDLPIVGSGGSEHELRSPAAREAAEKLSENDKQMLYQLESCIFPGDIKGLTALLQKVSPRGEGNLSQRAFFEHAWEVFQLDMAALGFAVNYDKTTGVFFINNLSRDNKAPILQSLIIDPSNERIFAIRKDPRNSSREELTFDLATGSGKVRCTRFNPFAQYTASAAPEDLQKKYLNLLVDELSLGMEKLEHQRIERLLERRNEAIRKQEEARKAAESEQARRKQDEELRQIMEQQQRRQ